MDIKRDSAFLSFNEDDFDLDAYQKKASDKAKLVRLEQGTRKKISFYKVLIIIAAFIIAYILYNVANNVILWYEYGQYAN